MLFTKICLMMGDTKEGVKDSNRNGKTDII
jgi:hypothetical protein